MRNFIKKFFKKEEVSFDISNNKPFAFLGNVNYNHTEFLVELIKLTNCKKYLELGIYDATTIKNISPFVDLAVGVDIEMNFKFDTSFKFYHGTTDNFFLNNNENFDVIFIDADHNIESVEKDFSNALNILSKYGIIILHDTDPISFKYTDSGYCGNSYLMNEILENNFQELNYITLPFCEAGLTIVNKKNNLRINEQ